MVANSTRDKLRELSRSFYPLLDGILYINPKSHLFLLLNSVFLSIELREQSQDMSPRLQNTGGEIILQRVQLAPEISA